MFLNIWARKIITSNWIFSKLTLTMKRINVNFINSQCNNNNEFNLAKWERMYDINLLNTEYFVLKRNENFPPTVCWYWWADSFSVGSYCWYSYKDSNQIIVIPNSYQIHNLPYPRARNLFARGSHIVSY